MGIYVHIDGVMSKGYEISILEEVVERLKKGEENFEIECEYGQGRIKVTTD